MEKTVAALEPGATCCGWNYSGNRLAVGSAFGSVAVYDSGSTSPSANLKAHPSSIVNVVWLPPDCGDAFACVSSNGTVSIWEEIAEDDQVSQWKICKVFESNSSGILDVKFGLFSSSVKMVAAYSDGHINVFELSHPLELNSWQLQAEFHNVKDSIFRSTKPSCVTASIAWCPGRGSSQRATFVIGFDSDSPQLNTCKIWEFEESHQRWSLRAELDSYKHMGDRVQAVAWAPNICRDHDIIAVATSQELLVWQVALDVEPDGTRLAKAYHPLSGYEGLVRQIEWDMGGMTLASTGDDLTVRLWQLDGNGVWQQQAARDCSAVHA